MSGFSVNDVEYEFADFGVARRVYPMTHVGVEYKDGKFQYFRRQYNDDGTYVELEPVKPATKEGSTK